MKDTLNPIARTKSHYLLDLDKKEMVKIAEELTDALHGIGVKIHCHWIQSDPHNYANDDQGYFLLSK